jgi:hypothetical protein
MRDQQVRDKSAEQTQMIAHASWKSPREKEG